MPLFWLSSVPLPVPLDFDDREPYRESSPYHYHPPPLKEELIKIRDNFLVQDYFYVVLGSEVSRNISIISFLAESPLDNESKTYLKEKLKLDDVESPVDKIRNPTQGSTIKTLTKEIKEKNISLDISKINLATKEYILFKTNKSLQGFDEIMVVSFACYLVFYEIGLEIMNKEEPFKNQLGSEYVRDPEFDLWMQLYTDLSNKRYYRRYFKIINYRADKLDDEEKKYLQKIFVQACQFEYRFLDELL